MTEQDTVVPRAAVVQIIENFRELMILTGEQQATTAQMIRGCDQMITMGCIGKLKLAMWDYHDLLTIETRKVWDRKEFDRRMARVREMDALGLRAYNLGPQ